jgi:hypothetical protein
LSSWDWILERMVEKGVSVSWGFMKRGPVWVWIIESALLGMLENFFILKLC